MEHLKKIIRNENGQMIFKNHKCIHLVRNNLQTQLAFLKKFAAGKPGMTVGKPAIQKLRALIIFARVTKLRHSFLQKLISCF
jgi:hypothetical protein